MNAAFRFQQSIAKPVTVSGFGYWSGLDVQVEFRPAAADEGFTFVRRDVSGTPRIPVQVGNRVDIPRRTTLTVDGTSVDMVEHILAALAGMHVDNCEIWVNRAEMPGCDGSSQAFVSAIQRAGIVRQNILRPKLIIDQVIRVGTNDCWILAEPDQSGQYQIEYHLDYQQNEVIGQQSFNISITPQSFVNELASARTFVLKQEADWMRRQGIGARTTYQDVLVFDDNGPIENQLRFKDECVRHKTLDVVGDMALAPFDIVGRITGSRSGHQLNAELVAELVARAKIVQPLPKSA